jgi:NAD(P)-dependent dehydrogenase (short-subunit alcohol dehydrogenase family)
MSDQRGWALITGGSRGIGRATAVRAARDGWDVAITYRSDNAAAEETLDACRALGVRAESYRMDLAEPQQIEALFSWVDSLDGPLAALVNNAGIVPPLGPVESYTADRIDPVFDVNVRGLLLCCREAVRRMSTQGGGDGGVIVNVSSRAAVRGGANDYVDYAASKAAVDAITIGLAAEVVAKGIRVVGVRPGVIETTIHAPGRLERVVPGLPLGRAGTPDEVANAIVWLMSPEASYVIGATLDVGGGR